MKNLLFITWDGPQTSYMEGLFMPIFHEISKHENIQFHVIQFTWADQKKTEEVKRTAEQWGIQYNAFPIIKKPIASLGSLLTLFTSSPKIEKYIRENHIDTVMPRSTFPAFMVNKIRNRKFALIFDADGLPLEERVDFSGLKKESRQYRWMKSIETKMLKNADRVITRSQKAIEVHIQTLGEAYRDKFSVVYNGRDVNTFCINPDWRRDARNKLGLQDELLFVYAGSLGPQYHLPEMLQILRSVESAHFLILTGNTEFALQHLPAELRHRITVKKVPVQEVPFWLNAADIAFALRTPSFSMQGVAPIKLGEYLLCGLPTLASKGIGDTEEILKHFQETYLFDHALGLEDQLKEIKDFLEKAQSADRDTIRQKAIRYFSLEAAAESYLLAIK